MATLYITEYRNTPRYWSNIGVPFAEAPAVATQTVTIGASSAQSAAFNANTVLVRVHTDAICSVEVGGVNPVAVATAVPAGSTRMVAGATEYWGVKGGDKIAVITNT